MYAPHPIPTQCILRRVNILQNEKKNVCEDQALNKSTTANIIMTKAYCYEISTIYCLMQKKLLNLIFLNHQSRLVYHPSTPKFSLEMSCNVIV